MAHSNRLHEFRRQWKKEIQHKNPHDRGALQSVGSTSAEMGHQNNDLKRRMIGSARTPERKKSKTVEANIQESLSKQCSSASTNDANAVDKQAAQKSRTLRFVDIFIADLSEIDPVPFFDIELPREVAVKIFKHLSAQDLCRCAQVSKSWLSLAEDELLWCQICHDLGYEEDATTVEKENWKDIVKTAVQMERTLVYNWKNRIGGSEELSYIPGGILTAVSSHKDFLVAGYTSLEVKRWDLSKETSCLLSPSSKSLVLQENGSGAVWNYVSAVLVNETHTFALHNSGLVNIWENGSVDIHPVHQSTHPNKQMLRCSENGPVLGIGSHSSITVLTEKSEEEYTSRLEAELAKGAELSTQGEESRGVNQWREAQTDKDKWKEIGHVQYTQDLSAYEITDFLVVRKKSSFPYCDLSDHMIITAINDEVRVHNLSHDLSDCNYVTQLYHTAFAPVQCMDYRTSGGELAILVVKEPNLQAIGSCIGMQEIQLYDVEANRRTTSFTPMSEKQLVLNLRESPENELVTGGYGSIRIYDRRLTEPVQCLKDTIQSPLSQIQMDEWKVVTGNMFGYVCVWDRRMGVKCWDMHNRHPVKYVHFRKNLMFTANVPSNLSPCFEDAANPDYILHKRFRGRLSVYDFSMSQQREELPLICQSTFDEPERYNYNIRLAMPYDTV